MTISFADATRALAQVSASTKEFEEACTEQIRDAQHELNGIDSALRSILAHQTHMKLPDGSYLYLKNCQSMRALNETRIARAVDALSVEQYENLLKNDESKTWSSTRLLCEAIADNLDAECVVHTTAPTICKKAPSNTLNVQWRTAPATVASHAKRFTELQSKLSAMRKHRSVGKKRAASVQAVAEPIVHAYLEEHKVSRQLIQFGGAEPVVQMPAFPEVPVGIAGIPQEIPEETIVHNQTNGTNGQLNGQRVMFSTRTYTSRGKAPKLNAFIDALPQSISSFSKDSFENLITTKKKEILKAMLTLYAQQFQADQGSVKKRLVLKPIV